jgi:hypothetical protein
MAGLTGSCLVTRALRKARGYPPYHTRNPSTRPFACQPLAELVLLRYPDTIRVVQLRLRDDNGYANFNCM